MNIIKALQQNEKPFGLMSEEMRAKAKGIGPLEFEVYLHKGDWYEVCGDRSYRFEDFVTYRLRPDYEENSLKKDLIRAIDDSRKNCLMKPWEFIHKAIGLLDGKDNRLMGHGVKDCSISVYDAIGSLIENLDNNWPDDVDNLDGLTSLIESWNTRTL